MCECKDCERRYVGCHSQCEDYKQYREQLDRINKQRRAYGEKSMIATEVYRRHRSRWDSSAKHADYGYSRKR